MGSKDWNDFGYFSPDFSPGMPVSQRIRTSGPNLLADMDPTSQIWTPLLGPLSILCIIFGN